MVCRGLGVTVFFALRLSCEGVSTLNQNQFCLHGITNGGPSCCVSYVCPDTSTLLKKARL